MSTTPRRPKRGKYTTKACEECRRRRAKCTGQSPCPRCIQFRITCTYTMSDGRRPAPKSYVLLLRQRIEVLEALLVRNGIAVPGGRSSSVEGEGEGEGVNEGEEESEVDGLAEALRGKLALDEANFDRDGEMRYFGGTSGRLGFGGASGSIPLQSEDGGGTGYSDSDIYYLDPQSDLDITGSINTDPTLEAELITLYFTWEQPWFPLVDETLFRESLSSGGKYWSPLLHDAILALGARFSRRVEVRSDPGDSNTAGRMFLERAKGRLVREMENPRLTTIQAVGVLGLVYHAIGADAAGWLHHGMASRLCLDMGLNLDPAGLGMKISGAEIQLRRQIYWAVYCNDKLAASYTGRVCSMLDEQGAVELPDIPDPDSDPDTGTTHPRNSLVALQRAMITLSQIQERILLSLWSPKPHLSTPQLPPFLHSTLLALTNWLYDLPPSLRIDTSTPPAPTPSQSQSPKTTPLPQAYTLQMIYHTARILLCKPFALRKNPSSTFARSVCAESARAICAIAQKYRAVFGGFQLSAITATHCTLSAAVVLLDERRDWGDSTDTEKSGDGKEKVGIRNRLALCVRVLDELAESWHIARLIGGNLRRLCGFSGSADGLDGQGDLLDGGNLVDGLLAGDVSGGLGLPELPMDHVDEYGIGGVGSQLGLSGESLPADYEFFNILNAFNWERWDGRVDRSDI